VISDNSNTNSPDYTNETWRDIPGWEGYQASSFGRIRSKEREVVQDGRWGIYKRTLPSVVLKAGAAKYGHLAIVLRKNGKSITKSVHQIVALTFIGECPEGMEVHHRNHIPGDNRPSNLEYVTHLKNMQEAWKAGRFNENRLMGENHPSTPLTEGDVINIRSLYADGKYSQRQLGKIYGVTYQSIGSIVRRKSWKHI